MRPIRGALTALCVTSLALGAQDVPAKTTYTADLGFVSATGNTRLTTLSAGDKITRTDGRWVLAQVAAYVYGKNDSAETANQLRVSLRADYAFRPRLAVFLGASYERNAHAGFNSRTDEILGLSWKAIADSMDTLGIDAGGVLTQETDVDGTSKNFPAARGALAYKHSFTAASYFQQTAEYIPNLKESGAYRANTESAIVAPLSAHVAMKASYVIRYDSRPPAKFGTTDAILTTGIQIAF